MPIRFVPCVQHRLTKAAGERWVLLPHAYGFVDPLFSTGIAWGLRAIERLGLMFEHHAARRAVPNADELGRYAGMLAVEADQIDRMVAGAYEAMAHFDLFAAHAMLYFATVSFSEVKQRIAADDDARVERLPGSGGCGARAAAWREFTTAQGDHARSGRHGKRGGSTSLRGMGDCRDRAAQRRRTGGRHAPQSLSRGPRRAHRAPLATGDDPRADSGGATCASGDGTGAGFRGPARRRSIHFATGPTSHSATSAGAALNAVGSGQP